MKHAIETMIIEGSITPTPLVVVEICCVVADGTTTLVVNDPEPPAFVLLFWLLLFPPLFGIFVVEITLVRVVVDV